MRAVTRGAGALGLMLISGLSHADLQLNMTPGVTELSQEVYQIHMMVMWICVAIGIVVFGAMIYSIVKHRKAKGAVAADFHENTTVEVVWTIIPFLILIAMAIPATTVLLAMEDTSNSDMSIKVTGYQWKWHYDYLGEDVSFFSNLSTPMEQIQNEEEKGENYLLEVDNKMVIPVNKKVRLLFTSNDVIHSWWVTEFGVKKDAIPGYINESWIEVPEPGIYRGKCTELCGQYHGFMPVVVEAKSEEDYVAWLDSQRAMAAEAAASAEKTWTQAELMSQGEEVYKKACAACHKPDGTGLPAAGFPALKGSPVALGDIAKHIDIIINGVSGTAMQAFGAQLNDADIAAVTTYERNAWGNDTGDVVQPADVKAAR